MERHEAALDIESCNVAKWLVLLSNSHATAAARDHDDEQYVAAALPAASSSDRVFECKTCNRRFSSFQALGGHRASHKKPKSIDGRDRTRPRTHECSICGLPFAIGQALGGHMRRHRNVLDVAPPAAKRLKASPAGFLFDLNLTPIENDLKSALVVAGKIDAVH